MDRIAAADGGIVRIAVVAPSGDPVDLDATPTLTVLDLDGAVVGTAPAVTKPAATTGVYEATIPAAHAACTSGPAPLSAEWSGLLTAAAWTRSHDLEVIGSWPFPLAELRAANTDLADPVRYPPAVLAAARAWALERVENITRVAFTPRRTRATLSGSGTRRLLLPHREVTAVHTVTIDGAAVDPTTVDPDPVGWLTSTTTWPAGVANITVDYSHGHQSCPADVAGAIRDLAAAQVVVWGARVPDRATSVSTDLGTFRLTLPGRDGPTGLPEVDAIVARHSPPAIR